MNAVSMKLPKAIIQDDPWADDVLERKQIAEALTNMLAHEKNALVVSLSGSWGTGKTFLLERWQAELEKAKRKAIYFNAWEDDYCGDPLVAIIGQIWHSLKGSDWKEIKESIKETAMPLFRKTVFNGLRTITQGVVDLDEASLKSIAEHAFDEYIKERNPKDNLKKHLAEMAEKVFEDTGFPLVFIVDELDRCRPTFAIEVLERIKHIFDIPHMVFVLGIDRNQLASCIRAVYGDIDVDGYLRRFFDFEFTLPPANVEVFCKHLMKRHDLPGYFQELGKTGKKGWAQTACAGFEEFLPSFFNCFSPSLRDIEHLIRMFFFTVKNMDSYNEIYPEIISLLLILRIKNYSLYLQYIHGKCLPKDILNYVTDFLGNTKFSSRHDLLAKFESFICESFPDSAASNDEGYQRYDALYRDVRREVVLLHENMELASLIQKKS